MTEKVNFQPLTDDELDRVSGGVVVQMIDGWYSVYDAQKNEIVATFSTLAKARQHAAQMGLSDEVWSEGQYRAYRTGWERENGLWK